MTSERNRVPHVVVLGLGRQGVATARYFAAQGVPVVVSDRQPAEALAKERDALQGLNVRYALGGHPLDILEGAALLHLSGGVPANLPIVEAARVRGIRITNDFAIVSRDHPGASGGDHRFRGQDDHHFAGGRHGARRSRARGVPARVGRREYRQPAAQRRGRDAGGRRGGDGAFELST